MAYAALAGLEGAFYPTVRGSAAALSAVLPNMPVFASFALRAALAASLLAPDAVLRERDRRTLEEWLALPATRRSFFWGRTIVWLALNVCALLPVPPLLWLMGRGFGRSLPAAGLINAALLTFAVAAVCGGAALLLSVAVRTGGRRPASPSASIWRAWP